MNTASRWLNITLVVAVAVSSSAAHAEPLFTAQTPTESNSSSSTPVSARSTLPGEQAQQSSPNLPLIFKGSLGFAEARRGAVWAAVLAGLSCTALGDLGGHDATPMFARASISIDDLMIDGDLSALTDSMRFSIAVAGALNGFSTGCCVDVVHSSQDLHVRGSVRGHAGNSLGSFDGSMWRIDSAPDVFCDMGHTTFGSSGGLPYGGGNFITPGVWVTASDLPLSLILEVEVNADVHEFASGTCGGANQSRFKGVAIASGGPSTSPSRHFRAESIGDSTCNDSTGCPLAGAYFSLDGPAVILPAGYSAHSAQALIENNYYVGDPLTAVEGDDPPVSQLRLDARPNPTRGRVRFGLSLPRSGNVELSIYSVDGRRIRIVTEGWRAAGSHQIEWDGLDANGQRSRAGVYFGRLNAPGKHSVQRVVMLR